MLYLDKYLDQQLFVAYRYNYHLFYVVVRSKDFRPAYGRIHEIRALIPPMTPLLACTATVAKSVREEVIKSLEMVAYEIISKSPDRPNIFYKVQRMTESETDLRPYIESLRVHQIKSPRIIVYCRSLNMCSELYAFFCISLERGLTIQM